MSYGDDPPDLDLGEGVLGWWTGRHGRPWSRVGLHYEHPAPSTDSGRCLGGVVFEVPDAEGLPGPRWRVESWDPLTVSPSLLCRSCGHHGFIREGRWVPA